MKTNKSARVVWAPLIIISLHDIDSSQAVLDGAHSLPPRASSQQLPVNRVYEADSCTPECIWLDVGEIRI